MLTDTSPLAGVPPHPLCWPNWSLPPAQPRSERALRSLSGNLQAPSAHRDSLTPIPSEESPGPLCPDTNHTPALLWLAPWAPQRTSGSGPFQLGTWNLLHSLSCDLHLYSTANSAASQEATRGLTAWLRDGKSGRACPQALNQGPTDGRGPMGVLQGTPILFFPSANAHPCAGSRELPGEALSSTL